MTRATSFFGNPAGRVIALGIAASAVLACSEARASAAECDAGIAMIRAESAKEQPKAVADALKTTLRVAEREKGEQEYDECLDAVEDARKALKKK